MTYHYKAWTLSIISDLELPEFLPHAPNNDDAASAEPDVRVVCGSVPESLNNASVIKPGFDAANGQLLLRIPNTARFLIENGRSITVDIHPSVDEETVRLFLLGSAFGALLHQRGWLPMHGSSMVINGSGWLLTGMSGAGKSTTSAALRALGHITTSDDVSVISASDNEAPKLLAGYPRAKLWVDVMDNLGLNPEDYPRVRPELEKRSIPLDAAPQWSSVELAKIIVIAPWNKPEFKITQVAGPAKLRHMQRQTYRPQFRKSVAAHQQQWLHYINAVRNIEVCVVQRPQAGLPPMEFAEKLLDELAG